MAKRKAKVDSRVKVARRRSEHSDMRVAVCHPEFLEDFGFWLQNNPKLARRLLRIMEEALRTPTTGIAKPEPLKALGSDVWSRRLTDVHRVVYVIFDDRIEFIMGRYHYDA